MNRRGSAGVQVFTLVVAFAAIAIAIAAWNEAAKPDKDLQQLSRSLENLTNAVEGMK